MYKIIFSMILFKVVSVLMCIQIKELFLILPFLTGEYTLNNKATVPSPGTTL